jgi:hypothetical protein
MPGSTLTAYFYEHVGWNFRPDGSKIGEFWEMGYKDAALEPGSAPIPPNQQITLPFFNGEVTLRAALWADGTSYGDSQWINRLRERRTLAALHNANAIAVLQKALDSGTDTPALIKQLQTIVDGITSLTVNLDDVALARNYYQTALRRFANPDGFAYSEVDGKPLHMTDRQIIEITLEGLERQRARFEEYQ